MRAGGVAWRLRRLRTMAPAEVLWRIRQAASARIGHALTVAGAIGGVPRPANEVAFHWLPKPTIRPGDSASVVASALRIGAGRFKVFALDDALLGMPPDWLRDPRTGTRAPLRFGKTLNYRDERLVGDIKYLWEPSRHLELVTLGQAWALTGDACHAHAAAVLLDSWISQNPYPLGPHWTSSLEHGVRLINWAVAWQLLDGFSIDGEAPVLFEGEQGAFLRRRWLDSIYRHQQFIASHLSRHSSANNHLLGELAGLLVASLTWPVWPQSTAWQELARQGFESETLRQNGRDGVNLEQGIWYHHEVADMMLIAGLAMRNAGHDFSQAYWDRFLAMLVFIASVMNRCGQVPMFGDSDDAVMLRLDGGGDFSVYCSLLASGAVLFGRSDLARAAKKSDDKTLWLLGPTAPARFAALLEDSTPEPWPERFDEGGYYILSDGRGTPDEILLVADAGPLGYLSIAAHGHADALSFCLSLGGREVLIDPGTYAYHTQQRWRDYFKGTAAHNTVRVDSLDQSISGGNFMWLRHARARVESFTSEGSISRLTASHDGYGRLPSPVLHRRSIEFDREARTVQVEDELTGTGEHLIEWFWHFAEDISVQIDSDGMGVSAGPIAMRFQVINQRMQVATIRGQDEPPLGWVSRRFDVRVPTTTVRVAGRMELPVRMRTMVYLDSRDA